MQFAAAAMRRPIHAVLVGPVLVLAAYGTVHVSPHHLVRPLLAATLLGFGLIGTARAVAPNWHVAGVMATLALLLIGGLVPAFAVLLIAWLFLVSRRRLWAIAGGANQLTTPLNLIAAVWLCVATAVSAVVSLPPEEMPVEQVRIAAGSNVYLLLLDAYPRRDTLMDYFAFDNGPFLEGLEERGFTVAENSHSQYTGTMPVVASMFSGRSAGELLGAEWNGSDAQYRRLWHYLNDSPIVAGYESAGYETYAVLSSAASLDLRSVDVVLESAMPSRFEDHLLGLGLFGLIDTTAMDRAELIDGFRHVRETAGTSPRFVFAHMMTPHNPYVFRSDGSPAGRCSAACDNHAGPPNALLTERFLGQLEWTNDQVLDTLDRLVAVDPNGVVILFSDHGIRRDPADKDEWYRTLFAARNASFPDDITPLDIFPRLLGATAEAP